MAYLTNKTKESGLALTSTSKTELKPCQQAIWHGVSPCWCKNFQLTRAGRYMNGGFAQLLVVRGGDDIFANLQKFLNIHL
uniref:Uncharacterized protein n=1 Tax=Romanomermis culicivorax TaxID=13658 RepID=A0A915HNK2_ROMCU